MRRRTAKNSTLDPAGGQLWPPGETGTVATSGLRQSGIAEIVEIPWGTHFCHFHASADDLGEVFAPFLVAGLERGEEALWVTSPPLGVEEAWAAMARRVPGIDGHRKERRLEVVAPVDGFPAGRGCDPERFAADLARRLDGTLARGCAGLRLAVDTTWLGRATGRRFTDYEAAIGRLVGQNHLLALCSHPLERCGGAEMAAILDAHAFALIRRGDSLKVMDISDRRRARQSTGKELRESAVRFRLVFDRMTEGFALHEILTDEHGRPCDFRFLEVNRGFERQTGLRREAIVGRRVLEVLPDYERQQIEAFGEVALTGIPATFERYEASLRRWYRTSAFRTEPRRFGVVLLDITEEKRVEDALRESAARLNKAEGIAHLGSWELDLVENRLTWSDEAFRIFGLEPQDFGATYETFLQAIHPDDRASLDAAYTDSIRKHRDSYEVQHRIVRPSTGEVRVVHEKCEHVRDAAGRTVRSVGMVHDITEQVRAKEALLEADRRRSEFLAVLSHELRNPLAPIRNSLFVLGRAPPGGELAQRATAVIDRQVTHLIRLVDDLLDLTRICRGKFRLHRERLELSGLVQRTLEDHRAAFAVNGVLVESRLAAEPMWLTGDPTRIAQAFGNLLGNAAKFTPRGGRVAISLDREGETAVLRTRDDGVGIAPEVFDHLFEPFSQAARTLDRSRGGLGLGLSLVKVLVELHGGSVRASSDGPGRGAEFTVRLPLGVAPEVMPPPDETEAARPRRVLVVEDNVDAADSLKEALELLGHEVRVAYDGTEGLTVARGFRPEVVLCDIGLPSMDGYQVARLFQADQVLRETVLVALTGYAQPEDRRRATEAGFAFHLAKPLSIEDLERVLASAV